MNSPEMAAEATEEDDMEVNCYGQEKDNKAGRQPEGPDLKTPLQVNQAGNSHSETTSEVAEENNMEASSSAEENKDKAGKQPKVSNLRAAPPQVNQAKNTPPDNPSAMEISVPKNKKTNSESVRESKDSMAESVMKCPKCEVNFASSVEFRKQTNDQCELNIGLHQDSGDDCSAFFTDKLTFTKQPAHTNASGQCPNCKHSFLFKSVASWTKKMGGLNIELSINISKGKLEETSLMDNLGMEQDDMDDISSEKSTGASGTQRGNRNCDEVMEQDDPEDIFSEKTTGRNTDGSSKRTGLNATSSRSAANSERWPFPSMPSITRFFKTSTPVVKVHYTHTSETFGADADIMKQLQNNLKSSMQLEITSRKNCSIIIVFCPVSRSFESEIKSALEKEVSSGKPFILVIMHHTRDPDYSTVGCDTSEVLKNVFYVHVFYHDCANGLLRCKQNDMAIKDIERKLQTYKQ